MTVVLDLFAGAGGWDLACLRLGLSASGVEIDPHCVATRNAMGMVTIFDDVRAFVPWEPYEGLVASPPCQDYSDAGKRRGDAGPTGGLTHEVARVALLVRPTWICCEQVPAVLPVWEELGETLRAAGYHTWSGVVSAEEYGVPQLRRRALFLASTKRKVTKPRATHQSVDPRRLDQPALGFLPPPVTMAQALGWSHPGWWQDRPATTLVSEFRPDLLTPPGHKVRDKEVFVVRQHEGTAVSIEEAAVLQGFPRDFRFQGPPTSVRRQIGNAIPPPLAKAAIEAVR